MTNDYIRARRGEFGYKDLEDSGRSPYGLVRGSVVKHLPSPGFNSQYPVCTQICTHMHTHRNAHTTCKHTCTHTVHGMTGRD
jgi:hypothetical protein